MATFDLVTDYGAVGDGATNDTTAVQNWLTAVKAAGALGTSPPGKTYLVDGTLAVNATCWINLSGSTLKKSASFGNNPLITITADCTLRDLQTDGNFIGSGSSASDGILITSGEVELRNVRNRNARGTGIHVTGSSSLVTAIRCRSDTNDGIYPTAHTFTNRSGAGDGFLASTSAVLRCYQCSATGNLRAGFFWNGAGVGNECYGSQALYNGWGLRVGGPGGIGRIDAMHCEGNQLFGFALSEANKWLCGTLTSRMNGLTNATYGITVNNSATGLEMYGCQHWQIGSFLSHGDPGYGVAVIDGDQHPTTYSIHNNFGLITVDPIDSNDGDPALQFGGQSSYNAVGVLVAKGCTMALSMGETAGAAPSYNDIGRIYAENCTHTVARWHDGGSYNHIGTIVARNCGTLVPSTIADALLYFGNSGADHNSCDFIDAHSIDRTPPIYIVHAVAGAQHNRVGSILTDSASYQTAVYLDDDGRNTFLIASTGGVGMALPVRATPALVANTSSAALAGNTSSADLLPSGG